MPGGVGGQRCEPLPTRLVVQFLYRLKPRGGDIFLFVPSPKDFNVNSRRWNRWVPETYSCTTPEVLNVLEVRCT